MTAFAYQQIYSIKSEQNRPIALELLLRDFQGMKLQEILLNPWIFEQELSNLLLEKAQVINHLLYVFPGHQFFLNITPEQAGADAFLPSLEHFSRHRVPPSSIALEITENWPAACHDKAIQQLIVARQMGFSLVLDDFGAGNMKLAYLSKLTPSVVKLDRSLLASAVHQQKNVRLLQSLVRFVNDIGAKSLIEGVETPEMLRIAKDSLCELAQGYHFDRPAEVRFAKMAS